MAEEIKEGQRDALTRIVASLRAGDRFRVVVAGTGMSFQPGDDEYSASFASRLRDLLLEGAEEDLRKLASGEGP